MELGSEVKENKKTKTKMGQLPTRTDPASIAELPSRPNVVVLMFVYSTAKVSHISYTCTVNLCTFSVCEMTSLFFSFFFCTG